MRHTADYVERAKAAEVRAAGLVDEGLKAEWRAVANGYRNLAQARLTSIALTCSDMAQKADRAADTAGSTIATQHRQRLAGKCRKPAAEKSMDHLPDGKPFNSPDTERFVVEGNISALFDKLAGESEVTGRLTLSRILLEEENKFAKLAACSDRFDLYAERCDAQILKHRALLDGRVMPPRVQDLTRDVLNNMLAIRAVLRAAQLVASQRLDRSF